MDAGLNAVDVDDVDVDGTTAVVGLLAVVDGRMDVLMSSCNKEGAQGYSGLEGLLLRSSKLLTLKGRKSVGSDYWDYWTGQDYNRDLKQLTAGIL